MNKWVSALESLRSRFLIELNADYLALRAHTKVTCSFLFQFLSFFYVFVYAMQILAFLVIGAANAQFTETEPWSEPSAVKWPLATTLNSCHLLAPLSSSSCSTVTALHCFPFPQCTWFCWQVDSCSTCQLFSSPVSQLYGFTWPSTRPSSLAELKRNQWSLYMLSTLLLRSVYFSDWLDHNHHHHRLSSICPLFNLFHLIWVVINDANVIIVQ